MANSWMTTGARCAGAACCLALAMAAFAADAPVTDASKKLLSHFAAMNATKTLAAKFLCDKQLAALDTPLESSGRLWIEKTGVGSKMDSSVRFSTEKPYVSELILTKGKVFARSEHEDDWTKTNQSSRPGLSAVLGQVGGWSAGDAGELSDQYTVSSETAVVPENTSVKPDSATASEPVDAFRLMPSNKDLLKAVKSILLVVGQSSHDLRYLEIETQQGDVTKYWFFDVKKNATLPAEVFTPKEMVVGVGSNGTASERSQ